MKNNEDTDSDSDSDEPAHEQEPNIDDLGDNKPTDRKE